MCAGYFVAPLLQDRLYHATRVYGMWLLCKEPKNASSKLSLRELSLKLTMLIALLSGQRCQTIHVLDINSMKVKVHPTQQYVFQINQLLKTSRPEKHFSHLVLQSYPDRKQLCVVKFFKVTKSAKCAKMSVNTIMTPAGWANTSTFSKFYDKPIIPDTMENFGHALLKSIHVA